MTTSLLDRSRALAVAEEAERRAVARFAPEPELTYAAWGERYRKIGKGIEPPPLRWKMTPYLLEPLAALQDPAVEEVSLMKPTQAGATDGLILTFLMYHIDQDPTDLLICVPTVDEAEKWSKKKLAPAVRVTPKLRGKLADPRSRSSDSTILEKNFPGGTLGIIGSNSERGFRMVSVSKVVGDDVDGWATSAGVGGDQVTLLRRRAERDPFRTFLWVSTPLVAGLSKIEKLFEGSDRRGRYHVPCPFCGTFQVLELGGKDTPYGLKWDRGKPATAAYLCRSCASLIDERHKFDMVQAGRYLSAPLPGGEKRPEDGDPLGVAKTVGYHFSGLDVVLPGSEWGKIAAEWCKVHGDPESRRGFVNTVLALTYEETNEDVTLELLANRREVYEADVPAGVAVLTMSVDIQDNRIEAAVWGWGAEEECWLLFHERFYGDPERPSTRERVDEVWRRAWTHASGAQLRILRCAIDAGFLASSVVYPWVRRREPEGLMAVFGRDERTKNPIQRAAKPNKAGVRPWTFDAGEFKDVLFARLSKTRPGPRYIHIPTADIADDEFLEQFGAEVPEIRISAGQPVRRWRKIRERNEAIDLYNLGRLALLTLGAGFLAKLGDIAEELAEKGTLSSPPRARGRRMRSRGLGDR